MCNVDHPLLQDVQQSKAGNEVHGAIVQMLWKPLELPATWLQSEAHHYGVNTISSSNQYHSNRLRVSQKVPDRRQTAPCLCHTVASFISQRIDRLCT